MSYQQPPPRGAYSQQTNGAYQPYSQQGQQPAPTRDDLQGLVNQTLNVQQDSAASSSRSAQLALQAQEIAARAANQLYSQGAQLDNVNNTLDGVSDQLDSADKKARYLEQVNRSMFIPVVGKNPNGTPATVAPQPVTAKPPPPATWASWLGFSSTTDADVEDPNEPPPVIKPRGSSLPETHKGLVGEWATAEEQARSGQMEGQIDRDLDTISGGLKAIEQVGRAIGAEVDRQNGVLGQIGTKVDVSQEKLDRVNNRVKKQLKK
ncbi:Protein transport protein S9 plasma membrane t-SNARE [Irineochytrium annulatum]|nr:Protein transport protein S9 plasma membrane t-SNARE [Irineochytrium annulatum]